jgi:nicotinamidase-related amidase
VPLLDVDDCVLIVIDLQPGFYLNRDDVREEEFAAVVAATARLAGLADVLAVPVVLTEELPDVNGGTAAEVMERLPAGSPVLPKPVFDLAADDAIRAAVQRTGRRHAVLAGLETDVCVLHSAVGLLEHGLAVSAVVDALFSPGEAQQAGLERLRQHGVDLISAKGVFYDWVRTPETARRLRAEHPDLAPTAPRLVQ